MTKLTYDYDSPENNAAVRIARAKLPAAIGNHLTDKKDRALYREGYALAQAFGFTFAFGIEDDIPYMSLETPVRLSVLQRPDEYWRNASPDDPYRIFHAGVMDGARDHPASREAEAQLIAAEADGDDRDDVCKTCWMAQELHDYMQFRAAREGVGHTLTVDFYRNALSGPDGDAHGPGRVSLFGVTFDIDAGELLADEQNPAAFDIWTLCDCCYEMAHEENAEFNRAAAA
jgi:hypothetical protein